VLEWGGLGVHLSLPLSDVGIRDDVQPFRVRRHEAVLDAVVHHLHEVAGAVRPAVVIAVLGLARLARASRGAFRGLDSRRDRGEDGGEALDDVVLAADRKQRLRATALAGLNRHQQASLLANQHLGNLPESVDASMLGDLQFRGACVFSQCVQAALMDDSLSANERDELIARYVARACELLNVASGNGFFRVDAQRERLKTEPTLDALRSQPQFIEFYENALGQPARE
jgi:hypothetical protein